MLGFDSPSLPPASLSNRVSTLGSLLKVTANALALPVGMALAGTPATDELEPVFAPPECTAAALSPDGKRVATLVHAKGVFSAVVTDLDAMKAEVSVELSRDTTRLRGDSKVFWVRGGSRILAQVGNRDIVAFDRDGTSITWLVDWTREGWHRPATRVIDVPFYNPLDPASLPPPILGSGPTRGPTPLRRVRIVALPAAEPEFVYVEGVSGTEFTLYRIHLRTGVLESVNRESVEGWLGYDRQGRPRLRLDTFGIPHRWSVKANASGTGGWTPLDRVVQPPDRGAFDLTAPAFFGTRSIPLGFDEDPNLLYLASNVGRDTHGIYGLDLRTGRRTSLALEHPGFDLAYPTTGHASAYGGTPDSPLVFDRSRGTLAGVRYLGLRSTARWLDPEISSVQRRLEDLSPTASIHIEDWNAARSRFLVHRFSRSDPGAYEVFDPSTGDFRRVGNRGPHRSPFQAMRTVPWQFESKAGVRLGGEITMPARPRTRPVPAIVFFRQSEWSRQAMRFNAQVAWLAHLGFAIVEVNHRGLAGFGTEHWLAGRLKADALAVEDTLAAVDHLAAELPLQREKMVFFGVNFGGYLAFRSAQLVPQRAAAVITVNPVINLPEWIAPTANLSLSSRLLYAARRWYFGPDSKSQREHSPIHQSPLASVPTLIVSTHEPSSSFHSDCEILRNRTVSAGGTFNVVSVPYEGGTPAQSVRTLTAIATFLERTPFPSTGIQSPGHIPDTAAR